MTLRWAEDAEVEHLPAPHHFPHCLSTASTCSFQVFDGQHFWNKINGHVTVEPCLCLNPVHEGTNAKPSWEYSPTKAEPGSGNKEVPMKKLLRTWWVKYLIYSTEFSNFLGNRNDLKTDKLDLETKPVFQYIFAPLLWYNFIIFQKPTNYCQKAPCYKKQKKMIKSFTPHSTALLQVSFEGQIFVLFMAKMIQSGQPMPNS